MDKEQEEALVEIVESLIEDAVMNISAPLPAFEGWARLIQLIEEHGDKRFDEGLGMGVAAAGGPL